MSRPCLLWLIGAWPSQLLALTGTSRDKLPACPASPGPGVCGVPGKGAEQGFGPRLPALDGPKIRALAVSEAGSRSRPESSGLPGPVGQQGGGSALGGGVPPAAFSDPLQPQLPLPRPVCQRPLRRTGPQWPSAQTLTQICQVPHFQEAPPMWRQKSPQREKGRSEGTWALSDWPHAGSLLTGGPAATFSWRPQSSVRGIWKRDRRCRQAWPGTRWWNSEIVSL